MLGAVAVEEPLERGMALLLRPVADDTVAKDLVHPGGTADRGINIAARLSG
jgi:hypothetical protein